MHWAGVIGLFFMLGCGLLLSGPNFARRHPQWVRPVAAVGIASLLLGLAVVLWEEIANGKLYALLIVLAGMLLWIIAFGGLVVAWQYWQDQRRRPRLPVGVDRRSVLAVAPYDYAVWQGEGFRIWHVDAPDDFLAGGMESQEEVEDWILAEMLRTGQIKHTRKNLK